MRFYITFMTKSRTFPRVYADGKSFDEAWESVKANYHDVADFVDCIEIYATNKELKTALYELATEKTDFKRIEKLLAIIDDDLLPSQWYEAVRYITRKITSDHSIKRYQALADWIYIQIAGRD